ncbi:creatininase family protein [Jiella sp. MQZ9-1]|uniref:Creatininase family protein n=1 Tax=Jiella flava TaxID=2816857 RepID=A0A939FYI1_9HYPH|nr:creatininase family protein [Jiella flava]MBO0664358.1 creatininase family protein [Jiella flava]MCD2472994.1 creatininase family protein [Jiella flava]
MALRRRFEEMSSVELAALAPDITAAVAVLPIAAIEQHGPHLPLGTDAYLADAMVESVIAKLPDAVAATFLPTFRIGQSSEHTAFPGTLSLDTQTLAAALIAIGEGLADAGFRRLVIVNSHGGNTPAMDTVALELRRRRGLLVGICSWLRFGYPEGVLPQQEIDHGIHGGAVETALMLHFYPRLVRTERIARFETLQARLEDKHTHLRAHGRLGFGWMANDLNPQGVVGDATLATPAIGAAIAAHQADAFLSFLEDVLAFDLGSLA